MCFFLSFFNLEVEAYAIKLGVSQNYLIADIACYDFLIEFTDLSRFKQDRHSLFMAHFL